MRSVKAGSFDRLSSALALWEAFVRCQKNKRRTPAVAAFDVEADRHIFALQRELREGSYEPGPFHLRLVHEPKPRVVAAAPVRDRVVHQALVHAIAEPFEARFLHESYAGRPGRGAHRAVLAHLAAQRSYAFRIHLDIRRYFPSVHLPTLVSLVGRKLRDARTMALFQQLLLRGAEVYRSDLAMDVLGLQVDPLPLDAGMPVGTYLSQWCGNVYLDGLDHYVKRELKILAYLRYMDDFVLFGNDAGRLLAAKQAIVAWLADNRGLTLNPKREHLAARDEPAIFLGYRISTAGIGPSPKLRSRMKGKLRKAAERGPDALERCIRAHRGLLTFG